MRPSVNDLPSIPCPQVINYEYVLRTPAFKHRHLWLDAARLDLQAWERPRPRIGSEIPFARRYLSHQDRTQLGNFFKIWGNPKFHDITGLVPVHWVDILGHCRGRLGSVEPVQIDSRSRLPQVRYTRIYTHSMCNSTPARHRQSYQTYSCSHLCLYCSHLYH